MNLTQNCQIFSSDKSPQTRFVIFLVQQAYSADLNHRSMSLDAKVTASRTATYNDYTVSFERGT